MNNIKEQIDESQIPLCVDLDGTLIKVDSILESAILVIKKRPLALFLILLWIVRGKNYFKSKITSIAIPDVSLFPYNEKVIEKIEQAKSKGRKTVLSTATTENIAMAVAEHTGLFDETIYSSENHNNRSTNKSVTLNGRFGEKQYDYIGNSFADLEVFRTCRKAILISKNRGLIKKSRKINPDLEVIDEHNNYFLKLIKELRLYQWIKNILIFLPLLLAHEYNNLTGFTYAIIGFFCFSFTASFIYVINDLLDLEADRQHNTKKFRPFAAGDLSPLSAFVVSFLMMLISFYISFVYLPQFFGYILLTYLILTFLYSFFLKKVVIADIIVLSMLYSIRIIAGGELTHVPLSKWFIAFSLFIFFSLAIIKRYTELYNLIKDNGTNAGGRGYVAGDIKLLLPLGISSGYLSVLIILLYIFSPEIIQLYNTPILLIPVAIILLAWISRMWFLATRGEMNEDPVVFTAKDKYSYLLFGIMIIFVVGAIFKW